MKKFIIIFLPLIIVLLNSCLGASADITLRADGSGKITLEYRVSQMLESIGRLDGNERWPAIPVGKADFERSLARIPGLRMKSFKASGAGHGADLVTKATLEFKDNGALLAFLDSTGGHASLIQDNGKNTLRLVFADPSAGINDEDLLSLLREISAGYEICFSLSAPGGANLSVSPASFSAARLVSQGKKVSFAIGLGDLLGLKDGLAVEIVW